MAIQNGLFGPMLHHARGSAAEVFEDFVPGDDRFTRPVLVGRRQRSWSGRRQGNVGALQIEQRQHVRGGAAGWADGFAQAVVLRDGRFPKVAAGTVEQPEMGDVRRHRRPHGKRVGKIDYRSDGTAVKRIVRRTACGVRRAERKDKLMVRLCPIGFWVLTPHAALCRAFPATSRPRLGRIPDR